MCATVENERAPHPICLCSNFFVVVAQDDFQHHVFQPEFIKLQTSTYTNTHTKEIRTGLVCGVYNPL